MVRAMFPGTFDPIHYGHIDIAERACKLFDELVVAVYDKPLKSLVFSPEERMEFMAKTLLSRPLGQAELARFIQSKERFASHYQAHPEDAKSVLTNGEAAADPALDPVEIAIWAMVANQFLNLDETLTK